MTVPPALVHALRALVGERHVLTRGPALLAYESDALPGYRKRPSLAVFPGTRDELLATVRLLAEHRQPFVPRGAGTGLSGGALADGVVLLGLHRLKRILAIDPAARTATVEPGVVNATLTAATRAHGLHYAPDPSSQTACTIGGNVAENAGGPHCLKYGVTLNHIVAATVLLPSGALTTLHAPTGPDQGPDLLGAFIGSEGCFGVAVDVTVRLTPDPEAVRTLLADFASLDAAAACTTAIIAAGILPAALEMMDQPTIRAVESSVYAAGYPVDAAAVLLCEVDGSAAEVPEDAARLEAICRAHGARDVRVAVTPEARARLWQGRKKAFGAMGRLAPHLIVQDAVVPRTQLPAVLRRIADIAAQHRVMVCNVFHAGDGNLHPNLPFDARDADLCVRVEAAGHDIMHACIAAGGTISGEHGVGLDKLPYMEALFPADSLDAMCTLRDAFDPERRANPAKVVPVHSCREWQGLAAAPPVATTTATATATATATTTTTTTATGEARPADPSRAPSAGHAPPPPARRTAAATALDATTGPIVDYQPDDLTITVRADCPLPLLHATTTARGQWCPLLPWGGDDVTVGELLARALDGPTSARLGAPRDLVLGLTFTDHRGRHIVAGGRLVKNVAGFDLTRLVLGAGGALGTIERATLRLRARPAVRETWALATPRDAERWAAFLAGPLGPLAAECVPDAVAVALGLPAAPQHIVWLAGNGAHVAAQRAALLALGDPQPLDEQAWDVVRRHGPYRAPTVPAPCPVRDALRARVIAAFAPASGGTA